MLDSSAGTTDPNGHGTAMAGIIAARTDNAEGIAGIGYAGVKVMPVTVLDANGLGQDSDIIAGVVWAVDHGADVINMSFSNPGFSESLQAAIDYAWANDVVVVAATGNDGSSAATFPAGDRGVIGVSNTDRSDTLAPSSNYGPDVFLAAPGVGVITTAPGGGTTSVTGTSASSAAVAAAAALLRANDPSASNGVIVGRLARTAEAAGTVEQTGNGRLQIERAIADRGTDVVEPAGAAPVGAGGPIVGPYGSAANNFNPVTISPTTVCGRKHDQLHHRVPRVQRHRREQRCHYDPDRLDASQIGGERAMSSHCRRPGPVRGPMARQAVRPWRSRWTAATATVRSHRRDGIADRRGH